MKKSARMMMMAKRGDEERRYGDSSNMPRDAFYDDRGRRHYDNGRYASKNSEHRVPARYDEQEYGKTDMGFQYPHPIFPSYHDVYDFDVDGKIGNVRGHASGSMVPQDSYIKKMSKEDAERWVEDMENADGTRGAHWKYDQAVQLMKQHNIDCDPTEFFVTMNMMYSDYYEAAKKMNVNTIDFYCWMAKAFLDDQDAEKNKLEKYYKYIVK